MRLVNLTNIKWDTDGEEVELPQSVTVEIDDSDDFEASQDGADYLSDQFGFLVVSFEVAVLQ